ncbi:hypothetical protein MPC4_50017 [Methylocella tundrae]|uniref:Uncharacterized protein n=1 Tax=Methylocella tundrae TaxID=227605 RepID=A0A8B6MBS5_METTU|nr:hypothetical protein MPC1_5770001 [Methylocella tundrae]VTZ51709.1 hypothetical protein MPC4_50017 [Methylocella tundrae]
MLALAGTSLPSAPAAHPKLDVTRPKRVALVSVHPPHKAKSNRPARESNRSLAPVIPKSRTLENAPGTGA